METDSLFYVKRYYESIDQSQTSVPRIVQAAKNIHYLRNDEMRQAAVGVEDLREGTAEAPASGLCH